MTMRIATTLMLGAALLAGAAADAQETKAAPAVPPRQSLAVTRTAAAQPRCPAVTAGGPGHAGCRQGRGPEACADQPDAEKSDAASAGSGSQEQ